MSVRIDKIEMQGFKSFAKKTQLILPSSFSIVCGPNGSGKSNVLDSVCFVLGRKSAKSLRAGRMAEMIFSGTSKTRASDFAKVSLTFNNEDKTFPIEDDKLVVSRKVNKKGISLYQMNGKTVTREKILEVLRRANVHPDGHNIILQGDITEIIEMSARGRREIIDEVAGIAEFDEKRDKAKNEIFKVDDRLKGAGIILEEREKNLIKLKVEADAAKKYDKLALELDEYRASLATKKLKDAEKAMTLLSERIDIKQEETEKFTKLLTEIDKELSEKQKKLKDLGESLIDRSKDLSLIKEVEKLRSQITSSRSRIETHEITINRLNDLIKRLGEIKPDSSASHAVKTVLNLKKSGVYGTVQTLSKVDSKYQTAVEVCAGGHFHDLITDTKETAISCVRHLKERKIGRATFLPLDKIQERDPSRLKKFIGLPGVIGVASDLVKFNNKYWHAFTFVFGGTLVVDKIETARNLGIGRARYVTLDGDLVERSGAIIGGFYRKKTKMFSTEGDIEKYKKEKHGVQVEIEYIQKETAVLQKKLDELSSSEESSETKAEEMNTERLEIEKELNIVRTRRRETYDSKLTAQENLNRLKINRARLEAELENATAEFDAVNKNLRLHRMGMEDLQKKINELSREIQKLGPINQKAIQEYETLKTMHAELKGKVDTLAKERERILQMIMEIEGRRKTSFLETLHAVSKHFEEIFHDIMGGQGTLRLEGEILDEAGLIIEATPPGRKKMNIDLMSGGQKTLTALAFLFAIQQFKPAPFYILDEVDAALDKPNSKKIVDLVMKYRDRAQFIVITHNDTTIHAADCVYGVSMESGISNLVGIRMP
jgi:chromosome segregation protein